MTILDQILDEKKREVERIKADSRLLLEEEYSGAAKPSLYDRLTDASHLSVISEMKRASPSKGMINEHIDPVKQALTYEKNGAVAISVLTDEPFFKGRMQDLTNVANAVNIPVLCKDFIIDEIQITRAKKAGASVILLIVAALSDERLAALYQAATNAGLDVLVEVHDEEEAKRALAIDAKIIGVNNRNLKTFEVSLDTTRGLAELLPLDRVHLISESGIETADDARFAAATGAKGILVGETLMRAENVGETLQSFLVPLGAGE